MLATYTSSTSKMWISNSDPDALVHDANNFYAEQCSFFYNSATLSYFICSDVDVSGNQTWIKWHPQAVSTRSQSNAIRELNTVFQISDTQDSLVNYSVDISVTATLQGGQTGTVFLEIATDLEFTENVQELCRFVNGNSASLDNAINFSQNITGILSGYVPAGYYCRLRKDNTFGAPAFNFRSGQEVFI